MIFFDIDGTLLDHAAAERAGALALRERHPALAAMAPDRFVERVVKGMLPKTSLGRRQLRKLKVYAGASHPHTAQQPQPFNF